MCNCGDPGCALTQHPSTKRTLYPCEYCGSESTSIIGAAMCCDVLANDIETYD